MTPTDQVTPLEQSRRLKELGVKQESLFSWFGDEEQRLMDNGKDGLAVSNWLFVSSTEPCNNQEADWRSDVCLKPIAAAFTVAELGMMLQAYFYIGHSFYGIEKKWSHTWDDPCGAQPIIGWFDTEAEARAAMLIYLLENNLITVEEVNGRL